MLNQINYIISILFFIFSLVFFSSKRTSIIGNYLGILGIIFSFISNIHNIYIYNMIYLFIFLFILSSLIGFFISEYIYIINIPKLISLLHSFVGLSTVLLGFNELYIFLLKKKINLNFLYLIEIIICNIIGSITFIGSLIAFFKISNLELYSFNFFFKKKKIIYSLFLFLSIYYFLYLRNNLLLLYLIISFLSIYITLIIVKNINSNNIPIVISLFNSLSGWSSSVSGFVLNNDLLIIIGAFIGSSGYYLAKSMCNSMNKSMLDIFIKPLEKNIIKKNKFNKFIFNKLDISKVSKYLISSKRIIIVPGYGMAVSQSQYIIYEIVFFLVKKYKLNIKFAIHPIAGRLPGHMSILLADAKIPYKYIYTLENINCLFEKTDLVFVVGANDIINSNAIYDSNCLLYGMPVLHVWKSKFVIILKRNIERYNLGYSKIENPVFLNLNTGILLGDAKDNLIKIFNYLKNKY